MNCVRSACIQIVAASAFLVGTLGVAHAEVALYSTFKLHGFDEMILETMGFANASVIYISEQGSITLEQKKMRENYEEFGCYPFSIMKDAQVIETGFNCQTFFCAGYSKGPKICKDRQGNPYGGVVEINRRYNLAFIRTTEKHFKDFSETDQSSHMRDRMKEMAKIKCDPYYLMLFDVAVGEGYTCEEVGEYPFFSSENNCVDDWRDTAPMECDVPLREDETEYRLKAIAHRGGSASSSVSSSSSSFSFSSSSVSTQPPSFPDVLVGQHGYTAIMDLAERGIVKGYTDGYFRPYQTVNRAEFSKLLIGGLHGDQLRLESFCFPDVEEAWYSPYVCAAKRLLWIVGYSDGKFYPDRTISKAEAIKIIVASMGVSLDSVSPLPPGASEGQWYTPYVRKAMELNLILEPSFIPNSEVTRADASVWIYRSLKSLGK